MNLDLHKELYFFEWKRKEQLSAATNLPIALITVLAGGMLFLFQSFRYDNDWRTIAFVSVGIAGLCAQAVAVYHVARSIIGYWYQHLPPSDQLQAFFEELSQWHDQLGHGAEDCQADFDGYLQARLAEATSQNMANNTKVAASLDRATRSLVFALILSGVSLVPYHFQALHRKVEATPIRVEGPVEFRSEGQNMGRDQTKVRTELPNEDPREPPRDLPPPKPVGPPNQETPLEPIEPPFPDPGPAS